MLRDKLNGILFRSDNRLRGQLIQTFGTSLFLNFVGVITGVLLARVLGPEGRGELAAIQLWGSFFGTLALVGIPEATLFFSSREPEHIKQYWLSGTVFSLISGLPILITGAFILPYLLQNQSKSIINVTLVYMLGLFVIFSINRTPLSILQGQRRFLEWNILRVLPFTGWLIAVLIGCAQKNPTPAYFAYGYIVVNLLMALIIFSVCYFRIKGVFSLYWHTWPSLLMYGLPLMLSLVPRYLADGGRLSQVVITAFLSPDLLGQFVVAVAWGNFPGILSIVIGQIIFPRISSTSNIDDRITETVRGIRLGMIASFGLCVPFTLLTPLAIPILFGQAFKPAIPAALILACATAASGIRIVCSSALQGWGRPKSLLIIELIAIIASIIITFSLIHLGILGVSISILITEIVTTLIVLVWLRNVLSVSFTTMLIPKTGPFSFLHLITKSNHNDIS